MTLYTCGIKISQLEMVLQMFRHILTMKQWDFCQGKWTTKIDVARCLFGPGLQASQSQDSFYCALDCSNEKSGNKIEAHETAPQQRARAMPG
jgi:hypothetical protein